MALSNCNWFCQSACQRWHLAQIARVERRLSGMEVWLKDGATRLPVSQTFQSRFKPM